MLVDGIDDFASLLLMEGSSKGRDEVVNAIYGTSLKKALASLLNSPRSFFFISYIFGFANCFTLLK
jgi:hypothetical protein